MVDGRKRDVSVHYFSVEGGGMQRTLTLVHNGQRRTFHNGVVWCENILTFPIFSVFWFCFYVVVGWWIRPVFPARWRSTWEPLPIPCSVSFEATVPFPNQTVLTLKRVQTLHKTSRRKQSSKSLACHGLNYC